MKYRITTLLFGLVLSVVVNVLFALGYIAYGHQSHFNEANERFTTLIDGINYQFDNYEYILNLITELWDTSAYVNTLSSEGDEGFLHLAASEKSEIGSYVHNFVQSLDAKLLGRLHSHKVRLFVRNIQSQELISPVDFEADILSRLLSYERCIETESCGVNSDELHYSLVHNTLIDGLPSIIMIKPLKGTDFYIMFHVSLPELDIIRQRYQAQQFNFTDTPFKLIELYNDDHSFLSEESSDSVFLHKLRFGYIIADKHDLLAPLHPIVPLFVASILFLTVIFYLLLRLNDQNALVKDRTKRTVTDQLTGAYNRYFIDFIKLKDSTLSSGGTVMYIDGNRVKAVNDKYGHDYGDKAIQLISNAFRTALKKKDYLVRMGGDEFVVILPDQKESDAQILYHNVNRTLQLQSAVELPLLEWTISVTVGYASYSDETNLKAAITEADLQMLSYKEQNTSR